MSAAVIGVVKRAFPVRELRGSDAELGDAFGPGSGPCGAEATRVVALAVECSESFQSTLVFFYDAWAARVQFLRRHVRCDAALKREMRLTEVLGAVQAQRQRRRARGAAVGGRGGYGGARRVHRGGRAHTAEQGASAKSKAVQISDRLEHRGRVRRTEETARVRPAHVPPAQVDQAQRFTPDQYAGVATAPMQHAKLFNNPSHD